MPRVSVPDGPEIIHQRMLAKHQPAYLKPWTDITEAVYEQSILPWRVKEIARYKLSMLSGCLMCKSARMLGCEEHGFTEEVYDSIGDYATSPHFSAAEKLSAEYAEKFSGDHHSIDDAFFDRLRAEFTEAEIVDLTFMIARHTGFGRLTHILGLDDVCEVGAVSAPARALQAAE